MLSTLDSVVLTQAERSSTRLLVIAVAFVVVGMVGLAIRSTGADPASGSTAAITVADATYEFTPTACTVTDTDFLVAGSGQYDGEDFWISVSPEAAEIALGTDDERDRSDDENHLWLRNDGAITWTADGDTIDATMMLRNERMPNTGLRQGRFSATCAP